MAIYDDTQKQILLSIPIEEVMSYFGKSTRHDKGGMYYSPLRDEMNMSFHVDARRNLWYDFGIAEGGGLIDLVIRLSACRRDQVLDVLAEISGSITTSPTSQEVYRRRKRKSGIAIGSVKDTFSKKMLLNYAKDRCIPINILNRYCKEVSYIYRGYPIKEYHAIGFPNRKGGYMLRSYTTKKCSSSDITLIGPLGQLISEPESPNVMVFEGFIDFLSWLAMREQETPGCDCCILNGVSNLNHALEFISEHPKVEAYLDNDQAGSTALKKLEDCLSALAEEVCVYDMRSLYESFKDLNERLMNDVGGHLCATNYTKHHGTNTFKGHPGKTGQDQLG